MAWGLFADGRYGVGWNGMGATEYLGVLGQGVSGYFTDRGFQPDWPGQLYAQLIGLAAIFVLTFVLTCFGIGMIGASTFFFLEVKNGRDPVTWSMDVLARVFSGVYYPLTIIPASVRWVAGCIPHTYALRGIRLVMINGAGFGEADTLRSFLVLLAFCAASLLVGIWLFDKALSKAERTNGVGIAT